MKKRHYIYTFLSTILLFTVLLGTYFTFNQIDLIKTKIKEKESVWQTEENRRNEIKKLERSVKDLVKEKSDLDSHFVSSENPVDFLNSLEAMALSVGAVPEVSTVATGQDNSELVINLNASGNFDSLFRFLTLIENSFYVMEVRSMSLTTAVSEVKNLNPKWEMALQIKLITFSNI